MLTVGDMARLMRGSEKIVAFMNPSDFSKFDDAKRLIVLDDDETYVLAGW